MQKKNLFPLFLFLSIAAFAQQNDTSIDVAHISGNVAVTNNGISLIPNFSLEQPAAIFSMSLQKGRFSIDPEFTFSQKPPIRSTCGTMPTWISPFLQMIWPS